MRTTALSATWSDQRMDWPPPCRCLVCPAMLLALSFPILLAALGFALIYLLLGGGLGGAVLVFIVAKILRR